MHINFGYRRPGFNYVVKQMRFWLFKVDCEFKDCNLHMLRIGHTCVIYTLRLNIIVSSEKNRNSQSLNYTIETRPTVLPKPLHFARVLYIYIYTGMHLYASKQLVRVKPLMKYVNRAEPERLYT